MVIYKTDYISIEYIETKKLVEVCWLGFVAREEYRGTLNQYLDVIKNYDVKRWISDNRNARVVRPVDQEWTVKEWRPQFFELCSTTIDKMARINPLDVSAHISSENMRQAIDMLSLPFAFRDFNDYAEARTWVLS